MSLWVVVATGQSLKTEDVEYIRGKCSVVVVSDAYKLAPWANILVSHDRHWWQYHEEAAKFEGEKYCRQVQPGTKKFEIIGMPVGCNSGLFGMYAAELHGATKIAILGIDLHGTHYFGPHPTQERNGKVLRNTSENRFKAHIKQFESWRGCEVVNCNPNSALKKFPFANIRDII